MYFTDERSANVGGAVVDRQITVTMRRERTPRQSWGPLPGELSGISTPHRVLSKKR